VDALKGVDMTIWPGEVVGLVGPSGSGKSTLLKCLGAVIEPTAGRMTLGGQTIFDEEWKIEDLRTLRRDRIGFIFQAPYLIPFLDVLEIEAADLDGAFAYADLVEKKIVIDRSIVEAAYRMRDNPDAAEVKLLLAKLLHEAIHLSQNHRAGMKTAVELYGAGFAVWLDEFLAESAASIFMPVTPDQYAFRESEELIGQLERSGDISPLQAFTLRRQIADRWAYIGLDMSRVINENQITAPTHVSVHGVENLQAALRDRRLEGVPVTDQILAAANGNRLPPQALTRFRIQFYDIHDPGGLELAQRYGAPVINTLGLVGWLERQRIISGLRLAADSGRVVYFDYNLVHAIAETWNRIQITSRLKAAA